MVARGLIFGSSHRYRSLSTEQEIVYAIIDEAGEEGVWTKTIKARSNLHDAVYRAAIKFLEGKSMIIDMKSVEHPARKMYIKVGARLSERATGGPWFTDGVLDEEFINQTMGVLLEYIRRKTFYRSSSVPAHKRPKKIVKKLTAEEAKAARSSALGPRIKMEDVEEEKYTRQNPMERYLPMPVGYAGYPSLDEVTRYIETNTFTTVTLTASEVQQLLDVLIFDDKIEKFILGEGFVYKALRKNVDSAMDIIADPLIEAPCGRCPVFDLCEEGGPVGPSNCEYYNDWLEL